MLSCTHCRLAVLSQIPQKRKFGKTNQSDCRNHKFPGFQTSCLTRYAASLFELNSSGGLIKHNILHYLSYFNSKWFKLTHQFYTNTRIFQSLVPVLNKLQEHHNLPFFDDLLQFWSVNSHEYLYSYFGIFRVNQNNFH